jgi:O-antigen ligase
VPVTSQTAAAILAAAGLCALLATGRPDVRRIGVLAWALGGVWLAAGLLDSSVRRLGTLLEQHPAIGAGALAVGVAALAGAAVLVHRAPWVFAVACVVAAPVRIPIHVGADDARLLLPLYGVLAAGALATLYDVLRGSEAPSRVGPVPRALAAILALSAISLLWAVDPHQGAVDMLFFYLPFGFMTVRVAQLGWSASGLRAALVAQVALALLFAAVGLWQEAVHRVFWNPSVETSNAYRSFFRVNSLFWDASVYGRFLAVTLVLLAGVAIYRGLTPAVAVAMAAVFAGLYFTYSQSSYLALAAGAFALGAGVWPWRVTAAVLAAGVVAFAGILAVEVAGSSADRASGGRSHLVDLGWRVIRHHPVLGAGLGGLAKAAVAGTDHPYRLKGAASHTTPVTVAGELGPLGAVAYGWLLGALVWAGAAGRRAPAISRTLLAALVAIFASSLFYDSFFEDPTLWLVAGLLCVVFE